MNHPKIRVPITETIVNSIPSLPEARAECKFIPNPNPTTEYCNRYLDVFLLNFGWYIHKSTQKLILEKEPMAE